MSFTVDRIIPSDHHAAPAGSVVDQRTSSGPKRKADHSVAAATDSGKKARTERAIVKDSPPSVAARHPLLTDKMIRKIQKQVNKLFELEDENEDNRSDVLPTIIQKACDNNEALFGNEQLSEQLLEIGNKEFDKLKEAAVKIPAKKASQKAQTTLAKATPAKESTVAVNSPAPKATIIEHSKITEEMIKKVKEKVAQLIASIGKGAAEDVTVAFTKLAKKIAIDFEDETDLLNDKDFINGVRKIAKEEYQLLKERECKEIAPPIAPVPKSGDSETGYCARTIKKNSLEELEDQFPKKFYYQGKPNHFNEDHYAFFTSFAIKVFNPALKKQEPINYDDLFVDFIKKFPKDFPELSDSDPTKKKAARVFYQQKIEYIIFWRFQNFYNGKTELKKKYHNLTDWQLVRFHECLYKHQRKSSFNMRAMRNEMEKEFPDWFKKFKNIGENSEKEQLRFSALVKSNLGVGARTLTRDKKFTDAKAERLKKALQLRKEGKLKEDTDNTKLPLAYAAAAAAAPSRDSKGRSRVRVAAAAAAAPLLDESDVAPIGSSVDKSASHAPAGTVPKVSAAKKTKKTKNMGKGAATNLDGDDSEASKPINKKGKPVKKFTYEGRPSYFNEKHHQYLLAYAKTNFNPELTVQKELRSKGLLNAFLLNDNFAQDFPELTVPDESLRKKVEKFYGKKIKHLIEAHFINLRKSVT